MRLIGLPGDSVAYKDKSLAINDKPLLHQLLTDPLPEHLREWRDLKQYREVLDNAEYVTLIRDFSPPLLESAVRDFPNRDKCIHSADGFVCQVPAGHFFVMGDHRDNSEDSRYWGFVPAVAIVGPVVKVLKP